MQITSKLLVVAAEHARRAASRQTQLNEHLRTQVYNTSMSASI